MRVSGLVMAVVALVALGGCSLIFPFEAPAASDASVGLEDGPDPDSSTQPDRGPGDFSCKDDAGCVACEPVVNKTCLTACTSGDCNDGLPLARDPWPNTCNKLLFEDDFIGCCPKWQRIHNGLNIYEKPCGVLEFDVATHTTQWMRLIPAEAGALPDDYLIEVRFFPPATTGNWRLWVAANSREVKSDPARVCQLDYDATSGTAKLHARINGQSLQGTALTSVKNGGVLQSWYENNRFHCRVNNAQVWSDLLGGSEPKGGTVEIAAVSPMNQPPLFFHLDWVRIFAPGLTP